MRSRGTARQAARRRECDLIEAGLNEAAASVRRYGDSAGGVLAVDVRARLASAAQTAICMQMTLAVERCTRQWRWSMTLRRAVRQRSNSDRHRGLRGAVAGSTASSIEADLDYGWRRRDDHDVSQWNG